MRNGDLVTLLDCTPVSTEGHASDGPVLRITVERHGEIEVMALTMRDCQTLLGGIQGVSTRRQTAGHQPPEPEGEGNEYAEKVRNSDPYDREFAGLRPGKVCTINVQHEGALDACDVIGGYRLRGGGPLLCFVRNRSYEPPRHYWLRFGVSKLDAACTDPVESSEDALERREWAWFLGLRANRAFVLRRTRKGKVWAKKLGGWELKRLIVRWKLRSGDDI